MKITLTQRADEHERYAPDAFASQIGKRVPLTIGDPPTSVGDCLVVGAEVTDDGTTVAITYELPEGMTLPWTHCPLCGEPEDGHDREACQEKLRNWQPAGLLALFADDPPPGPPYVHRMPGGYDASGFVGQPWATPSASLDDPPSSER